jgi:hypothetical protein
MRHLCKKPSWIVLCAVGIVLALGSAHATYYCSGSSHGFKGNCGAGCSAWFCIFDSTGAKVGGAGHEGSNGGNADAAVTLTFDVPIGTGYSIKCCCSNANPPAAASYTNTLLAGITVCSINLTTTAQPPGLVTRIGWRLRLENEQGGERLHGRIVGVFSPAASAPPGGVMAMMGQWDPTIVDYLTPPLTKGALAVVDAAGAWDTGYMDRWEYIGPYTAEGAFGRACAGFDQCWTSTLVTGTQIWVSGPYVLPYE